MTKYKKGDWVVTPYNKYPVQLDRDGAEGVYVPHHGGFWFSACSKEEAKEMVANTSSYCYAVKDPRDELNNLKGWYVAEHVRKATKKDLKLLVDIANGGIKSLTKELNTYKKAMSKL
jgi:hypothetical protein